MKKIYILAAAALMLAACDNNEDNPEAQVAIRVTATIGESVQSRASDTQWDKDDKIGISSTVGGVAGPFINYEYAYEYDAAEEKETFSGKPIFFYKPMTLTAYYPYTGGEDTLPGDNGIISAKTDAESQKPENQPDIDFLWDCKKGIGVDEAQVDFSVSDPNVNFKFSHKMSKVTFTFMSSKPVYDEEDKNKMVSDGVDVRTMCSYGIEGLGIEGTFDTTTGVCAFDTTKDREGLTITFNTETVAEEDKYTYTREFPSLIVFPQKKPDNKNFILHIKTIELKEGSPEQDYKCSLGFTDDEIKPGCHYKFTIKVTRRGLIVGKLTIEPWVSADEKFIIATIDGEENPEEKEPEN